MNEQQFQQYAETIGIRLAREQLEQFSVYYETLIEWNKKMNLTGITKKEDVYEKHYYDSLSAAAALDFHKVNTLCDVGAGAGFPSIPLAICFPHLHITIVDSLKKRIAFLEHLVSELNLNRVELYHDRAESFGRKPEMRESFDVVTARAVARLAVLSEFCLPLAKKRGIFLVMKGPKVSEEIAEAQRALSILGGKITKTAAIELPIEKSERNILVVEKIKPTPKKYPRKPGIPNKQPL